MTEHFLESFTRMQSDDCLRTSRHGESDYCVDDEAVVCCCVYDTYHCFSLQSSPMKTTMMLWMVIYLYLLLRMLLTTESLKEKTHILSNFTINPCTIENENSRFWLLLHLRWAHVCEEMVGDLKLEV